MRCHDENDDENYVIIGARECRNKLARNIYVMDCGYKKNCSKCVMARRRKIKNHTIGVS